MAAALPIMMVASTVLGTVGAFQQGQAAQKAAAFEAAQADQQAGQVRAQSQRVAEEERRKTRVLQSRTQALAAASGAGAQDPTVVNLDAQIGATGEYNALSALYEGENKARGYEMQADAARYEGAQTKKAYQMKGLTTALSGGSSLFQRYGDSFNLFGSNSGTPDAGSDLSRAAGLA